MPEIASTYKFAYHLEKLEAYLRNEQFLPATLELDISTKCNRRCPLCPSTMSPSSNTLDLDFIERLFTRLEGETRGLLLSGGEPMLAPIFPKVLHLAREYGFTDITIVTNGSLLDKERVAAALCEYASAIRVSIYDWSREGFADFQATLRRIKTLRSRIEREDSMLQIGVSALTSKENADTLHSITREVASAGAHWIYFHPMCIRWDKGAPEPVDQSGVLAKIKECQMEKLDAFHIFTFPDRYMERKIEFSGYHAAHFLLVIGADGMNYLGAEVKYHPQYVIADLTNNWSDDFLWKRERLKRIESVKSRTYPALASRHRGILYNQAIQDLIDHDKRSLVEESAPYRAAYKFPHIL
ncbi:MAG: radical SAM protein [Candidatus Bathyarchaeota archaeon]|nr:radical SAM protein [Candidatus Bathyarchaeota archaeon]